MHAARVTLWTQVLSRVYEKLGKKREENSILLASAGAFHDIARENEGKDLWEKESARLLKLLFIKVDIDPRLHERYVQAISEKDPPNNLFSTTEQQIVHDADCLEIMRFIGFLYFRKNFLCFYGFNPYQKSFSKKLIQEVYDFIKITEDPKMQRHLESYSKDFYMDLIRLLFELKDKFPLIISLLEPDMEKIL